MAAAVITVTKPSDVKGQWKVGNRQFHIRDVTADTGTYTTGGFTLTAAQFGLKHFDFVLPGGVATNGTAGATANPVGIRYASDGTSITVQVYEAGASGAADGEKTNTEAYAANWTIRLLAAGQ
jgi:hypothetical protein